MSASSHSRSGSHTSQSTTSSSSSYQVILDHILSYPGTYDIPLRRMYELNCAPHAKSTSGTPASNQSSPTSTTFPWLDHQARAAQFAVSLSQQISQLPTQSTSLPPSFVTSFVRKCFSTELAYVDFPHALAALDYMKDLEKRRKKEVASSLRTLGINESTLETTDITEEASRRDPRIADWISSLETKEKRIDQLYSQCYVAIRRWIMINEMSLTPFNKHNCIAMLNTLYPPVMSTPPTRKLTTALLKAQREGFFKYIQTVEKRGVSVLDNLINQGRKEGDQNGWPATHRFVLQYLTVANSMIAECEDINAIEFDTRPKPQPTPIIASQPQAQPASPALSEKRKGRQVDSGVSFTAEGKHSKTSSTSSSRSQAPSTYSNASSTGLGKGGSTLERLARELRKMRPKGRLEVDEIIPPKQYSADDLEKENASTTSKQRGLRRLRSLGALGDVKHSNSSVTSLRAQFSGGVAVPPFDAEAMKKERAAFERRAKANGGL
jgi:hypothetical protein